MQYQQDIHTHTLHSDRGVHDAWNPISGLSLTAHKNLRMPIAFNLLYNYPTLQ